MICSISASVRLQLQPQLQAPHLLPATCFPSTTRPHSLHLLLLQLSKLKLRCTILRRSRQETKLSSRVYLPKSSKNNIESWHKSQNGMRTLVRSLVRKLLWNDTMPVTIMPSKCLLRQVIKSEPMAEHFPPKSIPPSIK